MRVTVTAISVPAMSPSATGQGLDENGENISFVGDHRPMRDLLFALAEGEEVVVELEDWQILHRAVADA